MKLTCESCVKIDEVFQTCLDDLVVAWDNVGYHVGTKSIHCPCCGKYLTVVEA